MCDVLLLAVLATSCTPSQQEPVEPPAERLDDPIVDDTRGAIRNDPRATPGYTLYGGLISDTTYLIDNDGMVVHTWTSEYAPSGTAYLLDSGNIVRGGRQPDVARFNGGGQGGRLQEITWDGDLVWDYLFASDDHLLHHDVEPLPNGNILAIAWNHVDVDTARDAGRRIDLLPEHGLWPDTVVELEPVYPDGARVVWEWRTWDHLVQATDERFANYGEPAEHPHRIDINGVGGPVEVSPEELARLKALGYVPEDAEAEDLSADLFHTNSLHYNAELDQIVLSVPEYNEIWIIDHSTTTEEAASSEGGRWGRGGDLLYRWGNPQAYGRGTSEEQMLGYQHDVRWIPAGYPGAGNLTVFSNRNGAEDAQHSRVYEITVPADADGNYVIADTDDAPFGPLEPVWTYTATEPTSFFASFISGAHRLMGGNTFVTSGPHGRFFEVTPDGEILWEYRDPYSGQVRLPDGSMPHPVDEFTHAVFRATRIAPDHPALAGRTLAPLNPQPEIPEPSAEEEPTEPAVVAPASDSVAAAPDLIMPPPDFKVAVIGDSGYGPRADAVLALIREEGAQLVLHQGDLGYDEQNPESPRLWHSGVERMLDASVEGRFPYLYSVGNHDLKFWDQVEPRGYSRILSERTAQTDGLECEGELGVNAACTYQGLFVVLSGAGTKGDGHGAFMAQALNENPDYLWRISSWHKNQHDMQAGGKTDDTGWAVYQESQRGGAIIVTGHEHSYSRSYTLTELGNQAGEYGVTGDARRMEVGEGKTFVLVSGLGGKSGRDYDCGSHEDDTWWASVFARNYYLRSGEVLERNCSELERDPEQIAQLGQQFTRTVTEYNDGALFITFNVDGRPNLARGEFVTVDGHRIDEFEIVNLRADD